MKGLFESVTFHRLHRMISSFVAMLLRGYGHFSELGGGHRSQSPHVENG